MSERETQGGCLTHGPYEVCGHTTETCPDKVSGETQEVSTDHESEKGQAAKRLESALALAEEAVASSPDIAPTAIRIFHETSLKKAEEAGVDISEIPDFQARLEALIGADTSKSDTKMTQAEIDRLLGPELDERIDRIREEQMFKMQEHAFGKAGAIEEFRKSIERSPWTAALKKFDEIVSETGSAGKPSKFEVNKTVELDVDGQPAVGVIVKAEGSVYLMETEVGDKQMITLATEDEIRELKH